MIERSKDPYQKSRQVLGADARDPWLKLSTQAEQLFKEKIAVIGSDPSWAEFNHEFFTHDISILQKENIIGRVPVVLMLEALSTIPVEKRGEHYAESVDAVIGIITEIVTEHLQKSFTDDKERRLHTLYYLAQLKREKFLHTLSQLGSPYKEIAEDLTQKLPEKKLREPQQVTKKLKNPKKSKPEIQLGKPTPVKPAKNPVKTPKRRWPKPQKEYKDFHPMPVRSAATKAFLQSFPYRFSKLSYSETMEKLAMYSLKASKLVADTSWYDIAAMANRFKSHRFAANLFFKETESRLLKSCRDMCERKTEETLYEKSAMAEVYSVMTNFYSTSPELNQQMHDAYRAGFFDHDSGILERLVVAFAYFLPDANDFKEVWDRMLRYLGEREPSLPKFVAAGAIRGMPLGSSWEYVPLDESRFIPSPSLLDKKSAEGGVYKALRAIQGEHFSIHPEYDIQGFSVDFMLMDKQGARFVIEFDGEHYHYIDHDKRHPMFWEEELRESYIHLVLGMPVMRIPSTEWPYDFEERKGYLKNLLRKHAPSLIEE